MTTEQYLAEQIPTLTVAELEYLSADNGDETDFDDSDNDDICHTCRGSGIGMNGDPDTSRCATCGGSGVVGDEYDEDAHDWYDGCPTEEGSDDSIPA